MKLLALMFLAAMVLGGCDDPRIRRARVIETYLEVAPREYDDWRTTVEYVGNGERIVLFGKLGEPGDEFTLPYYLTRAAP